MFALVFRVSQLSAIKRTTSSLLSPSNYNRRNLIRMTYNVFHIHIVSPAHHNRNGYPGEIDLITTVQFEIPTLLQTSAAIYQFYSFIFTLRISLISSSVFGFVYINVHKTLIGDI